MEIINQSQKEADLADAIVMRTHEVYGYDINISNYEAMLGTEAVEWPERLLPLRSLSPQEAAAQCPTEDIDLFAQLQLRDHIEYVIKTEKMQRARAQAILEAVDSQLTGPNRDTAIEAAIARRNASMNL